MTEPRSLYEIDAELALLLSALDEEEGFDPDSQREAIDAWLDGSREEIEEKVDRYCAVIRTREVHAKGLIEEIKALQKMLKVDENVQSMLKDRLMAFFERAGIEKMQTRRFAPRVQANGGLQRIRLSAEAEAFPDRLPEMFQRVEITPDMDVIRYKLELGTELDFATLEPRSKHLRLR